MNALKVKHPVLRYHGAKFRLAPWIIQHMPAHTRYVESFGGAAGVLLQKPRTYAEIYNDLDGAVVNVFRVIRDPSLCARLCHALTATPYAREEFELANEDCDDVTERARRTIIRAHMGFGSASATKAHSGFRVDSRRSYGLASHIWAAYPELLQTFCTRFADVIIENRPALDVIAQHDDESTLHFVDPPYVHATRHNPTSKRCYRHELTDDDHRELITQLKRVKGMVMLCGYESHLYLQELDSWNCYRTNSRISSNRGTGVRTECLWMNEACSRATGPRDLFDATKE